MPAYISIFESSVMQKACFGSVWFCIHKSKAEFKKQAMSE